MCGVAADTAFSLKVKMYRYVLHLKIFELTISLEIIPDFTVEREKEHCAIFIHAHLIWGLQLGLGLS